MCDRAALPVSTSAAPAGWPDCTRTFPGRAEQISAARALIADFLDGYPAADDAILLVSELCANAVAHSASGLPGGTFTVRARLDGAYLHAEVEDRGSAWDGDLSAAARPHGLYLLRALSTACGARQGHQGWVTWFDITARSTGPVPQP